MGPSPDTSGANGATALPVVGSAPDAALPDVIKEKLRLGAEESRDAKRFSAAVVGARLRQLAASTKDRLPKQLPKQPGELLRAAHTRIKPALAQRPAWLSLRKVQVPQLPQELRDGLVDRGRRAGVNIGTAIDKIVRELPEARRAAAAAATTPRADPDADISTVAVRRAVKQPSIFAPGHLLTALLAGGIIHIATTFAITALGTGSAYRQLRAVLPVNELVVLPPQAPGAQLLPFLAPDMLYGICRFDLAGGGVQVAALLPEAGWSLALYTRQGDNFYATPGQGQKPISVGFILAPASERLINLTPGVRKNDVEISQVTSPDSEGLIVIRAPLKGVAFEAAAQAELKRAKCTPVRR